MSKPLVLFDPGHGGTDPGAVQNSTGRKESDDVLKLYQRCKYFLSKSDVRVDSTRTGDYNVRLENRPSYSNEINADIMVSLHRNSGKYGDTTANGIEIWVHPKAPSIDTAIAQQMLESLAAVGIQSNRGIKYGSYVILTCKAPAVMIELGFMNNIKDNELFDKHLDAYAKAIAKSICNSLRVPFVDPKNSEKPVLPSGIKGYRIVVAYNENPELAQANVEKAIACGFKDAYPMAVSDERAERE